MAAAVFDEPMEMTAKKCQSTRLSPLTRRCVYHVVCVLHESYSAVRRQAALFGQITAFCSEVKRACGCAGPEPILAPHDLHRFADGSVTVEQFCATLEDALLRGTSGHTDLDALQNVCYQFYHDSMEMTKEGYVEIEMLPRDCKYKLWVIFNVLVGRESTVLVGRDNFRDLLKRLVELIGLSWINDPEELANKVCLTFSEYIRIIMRQFERQDLQMPLTCEMIEDVYDEFVCGVQMKGYLFMRGYVRMNLKRQWFILQRTKLSYFQSKDAPLPKVIDIFFVSMFLKISHPRTRVCVWGEGLFSTSLFLPKNRQHARVSSVSLISMVANYSV